jgi:hypothetical protein
MKFSSKFFLTSVAFLLALSCVKDEVTDDALFLKTSVSEMDEVKMVPFKGDFLSTPNDIELVLCIPPEAEVAVPKINAVEGNATHLGILQRDQSPLFVVDCYLNFDDPEDPKVITTLDITLRNKKGDGIRLLGQSTISLSGPASGSYEIVEGFGKFSGATGSATTTGFFNPEAGSAAFSLKGSVTQPNRN